MNIQTQPKKTNILSAKGSYNSPNYETRLYFLAIKTSNASVTEAITKHNKAK